MGGKVGIDTEKLSEIMLEKNFSPKELWVEARISESTWVRMIRDRATAYTNAVTIAYVLKIDPFVFILDE